MIRLAPLAAVSALALAACGGGRGSANEGAPQDIQIAHPAGVVLQVRSVAVGGEATLVRASVMNGRNRDIQLNPGRENTYLLTDAGEKLFLVTPPANGALAVPAGRTIDAALVFAGALPRGERATLVINQHGRSDSVHTNTPRFEAVLAVGDARGARGLPDSSGLSGMRPNTASRLGPAANGGSQLGAGGLASSNLQVVQALKTELGAVQTDRGAVVSLPSDVTFDFDKSTIRAQGRGALDTLARLIQADAGTATITIEGHTDSRGDDAYNLHLSRARADAVKAYLVEKGAPEARLRTIGLGEQRPVAPNAAADGSDDEAGRQRNRRVEVVLPIAAQATEDAPGTTSTLTPAN